MNESSVLDFTLPDIQGTETPLSSFSGKVLLIVNVASKCGFTPQYEGLQALYTRFREKGLVVMGFPANNFLRQEPGSEKQIQEFCTVTYGVTFPLFSKISVKGKDIHPLYRFLTERETNPDFSGKIGWNFAKFLVDRGGRVVARFEPKLDPLDPKIVSEIEKIL
ncbi:MAG: glutathione peroxidase [Spirochaetia bacterium]|jgi:glutathione peroxidase